MSTIEDIFNANKNLNKVLKPLKGGGGVGEMYKMLYGSVIKQEKYTIPKMKKVDFLNVNI